MQQDANNGKNTVLVLKWTLHGSLVTMAWCPQAADGGDSFQIWRVAANVLNKQLWTANKG
jgi:hypothetical protein